MDLDLMDMQAQARHTALSREAAGSVAANLCMHSTTSGSLVVKGTPYLSKIESVASSAVRAADKVGQPHACVLAHAGTVCM